MSQALHDVTPALADLQPTLPDRSGAARFIVSLRVPARNRSTHPVLTRAPREDHEAEQSAGRHGRQPYVIALAGPTA